MRHRPAVGGVVHGSSNNKNSRCNNGNCKHHHNHGSPSSYLGEEDPLSIFESRSYHANEIDNDKDKPSRWQQLVVPEFMKQSCTRQNRRYWVCYIWFLIIIVMITISWKVFNQVNNIDNDYDYASNDHDHPLPATIAEEFLAMFFPTAWKLKRNDRRRRKHRKGQRRTKTILYYNEYWNFEHFQFGEYHKPFVEAQCPIHDCIAIQHRPQQHTNTYRASFDAVLFHIPNTVAAAAIELQDLAQINQWRQPHQRFIYMNMESPQSYDYDNYYNYNQHYHPLDNFFNWTMTYRLDSDLPRPYGFFELLPHGIKSTTTTTATTTKRYHPEQWKQKQTFLPYNEQIWYEKILPTKDQTFHQLAERPKKVAWIVSSHCRDDGDGTTTSASHREAYVAELQKYIQVDIFGGCDGAIPCNTSFSNDNLHEDNCTQTVERDYKFYLAFENSFCNDYVTEKFFRRLAGTSSSNDSNKNSPSPNSPLVVVMGGANYSKFAPQHSYINALDYESPKALATKLHQLDLNHSQYLSYFWWKDYYKVHYGTQHDHDSTMCKLCQMLHDDENSPTSTKQPPKVYANVVTEWHDPASQCFQELPKPIQHVLDHQSSSSSTTNRRVNEEEEDVADQLLDDKI